MASQLIVVRGKEVADIIDSVLDVHQALKSQAAVFKAYSSQADAATDVPAIQTPQRLTIQSTKSTSLFMPARVAGTGTACKIVSIPKGGAAGGLPATTIVMDEEGRVKGIVNARRLTALRNACASALFLQACPAKQPPTTLVVFGSGAQAQSHSAVFLRLYPSIKKCSFAVRSVNDRAEALAARTREAFSSVQVDLVTTVKADGTKADVSAVVNSANIIVTVTSSTEALFASKDVAPGTQLVLIGSYTPRMREVEDDLVKRAGIVAVDSASACGHEAGELLSAGLTAKDMVELGTIIDSADAAKQVGKGGDVLMFKSVGLGIQDVAIADLVFEVAKEKGLGQVVADYD